MAIPSVEGHPLINPVTGAWLTDSPGLLLRGIYAELRLLNKLIAEGLSVNQSLESYRRDSTSIHPDVGDRI